MLSNQVVPENQLCFNQFDGVESHFFTILNLISKAGFEEVLNVNTRVYSNLVEEFYLNSSSMDGEINTKVKYVTISFTPREVGLRLGFVSDGDIGFSIVDTKKGLDFIGFKKNNQETEGYKKKVFS